MMEIILWIVGIIAVYIVYAQFAGKKLEQGYRRVIADLMLQLTQNPEQFFAPDFCFAPNNFISERELTELLMRKVILLALERNVRSPLNANIIPSDLNTLPDVKHDFLRLVQLAYSIVNDRG